MGHELFFFITMLRHYSAPLFGRYGLILGCVPHELLGKYEHTSASLLASVIPLFSSSIINLFFLGFVWDGRG